MVATASAEVSPDQLETYRRELTGYCYRMLGSGSEADDAVQETMLRAWRAADGFEGVLFCSSARPAGLCVCVFATGEGFAGVRPEGNPERISAAPVPPRGMRT